MKKYTSVDFLESRFFGIPEGLKIPFDRSGKAEYEISPHYKVTFYQHEDPPKKADLSKQFFSKKTDQRRQTSPVKASVASMAGRSGSRVP